MEYTTPAASYSRKRKNPRTYLFFKRWTDICVSLLLLLLLSPLLLYICWHLYKKEGKPLFYRELAAGKGEKPFIKLSFRTTTNPSRVIRAFPPHPFPASWEKGVPDQFTFQRDKKQTMTATGLWLRKYNLHLLPQLWNVLKGEMSLVGPRPEIAEIAACYNQHQRKRLLVKPGITGYTQLYFGKESNYNKKVFYDLYYVENRSYKLDLKILLQSLRHWKRIE